MALRIRAVRNNLGTSESAYYALASWSEVVESDDFIRRMAAGRTTLSKTDIIAVFQLAREELCRLLAEGCYVKTPLGSAIPRASGKLGSPHEPFQPGRGGSGHSLRFDFHLDPSIASEALASLSCVRDSGGSLLSPRILSATSIQTGKENKAGSKDLLLIAGKRMKFDPGNAELGVFFRGIDGAERRSCLYAQVRPSTIIAEVPAELGNGEYCLVIRTVSRGGTKLEGRGEALIKIIGASET
jgi:DNA-binding domain/Domain of unknown function (DUF4469) with IG-like fold